MMKNILIIPNSASGHVIPTFQIAHIFRNNGYQITYLVDAYMKNLVKEQGFEVVVCPTALFVSHESLSIFEQKDKKILEKLADRVSNSTLNAAIKNLLKFEEAIDAVAPDCILMDVFLSYNYILLKNKRPTIFIQTMVSTFQDDLIPPLSSVLLPKTVFQVRLEWAKYKLKREWDEFSSLGTHDEKTKQKV
jgi:UDP:flavonoid glycosyltransferase YjiC (YdhE family)